MFGISRNSSARAGRFLRFRRLRAFSRQEDGVAAVEFALVALPFLAILFAILETAMVFLASQTLETAAADSARLIYTGQAQTAGMTQEQFRESVCARIFGIFDCGNAEKMTVDVKSYPKDQQKKFSDVDVTRPVDENGKVKPGAYEPGTACDIVVVRLIYKFPVFTALMGLSHADTDIGGSNHLLVSTSVFRNEPFTGPACG